MAATWILVADSSRAKLYAADTALGPLQELESFSHPESRAKNQDLTSDGQGRSFDNKTFLDYDTEPKKHEAILFAKQLGEHLNSRRKKGVFDKLYLVASPNFLGLLRDELDSHTEKLIADQIPKDLTQHDADDVRRHLPERL